MSGATLTRRMSAANLARRVIRFLFAAVLACVASVPVSAQTFRDVTEAAGIDYVQFRRAGDIPAAMQSYKTGGVAAGDYDGDGLVDLYVTRLDDRDILYRNSGDGTFADVTEAAFGAAHLADVQSNGASWGDIDNDGDLDLYVTSLFSHRFHLFVNDGAGRFSEEAMARGAATEGDDLHFGFSAAFGDYDLDGYLDLHTTEWRFLRQMTVGAQSNARLLRNRGAQAPGSFEDVTRHAGVSQHRIIAVNPLAEGQSLTSTFALLDDDLYPELIIVADHNASQLYWNRGNGRFAHGTTGARVGTDEYGMGSAVGDYDGDGRMDWFVSAIYEEGVPYRDGNRLYRNLGRGFFEDATDAAGVRDGSWGWGTTFLDYDNDGDLDLVLATGVDYADEVPYTANTTGFADDPMRLWRNDGSGRFTEVAQQEGLTATGVGTGLAAFDLEPDGDLDLLVVHNSGRPVLYRNDTNRPGQMGPNRWLQLRLEGTVSNRQGVGARITVTPRAAAPDRRLVQVLGGSNNYLGQNEAIAHFGLGLDLDHIATVQIEWPSGARQTLNEAPTNRRLFVIEPVPPAP